MKVSRETLAFCFIATLIAALMAFHYLSGTASGTNSAASGVPLDDVYIHFQYAKNFAEHGHFYYNVGEDETGATSPLWALILSIAYKFGLDLIASSKAIGLLLHLCSTILIFLLFKEQLKTWWMAWAGAFALLLSPMLYFYSLSGMDLSLFVFLLISVFYFFIKGRYTMTGVVLGLSILARPEGLIMLGLLLVYAAVKRDNLREFLKMFLVAALIAAPWFIYCFLLTGRPLPSTFYAKTTGEGILNPITLFYMLLWPIDALLFSFGALLLMYVVGGWRYLKTIEKEITVFLFFPPSYMLIFATFASDPSFILFPFFSTYPSRYIAPILVFLVFFMISGLDFLLSNKKHPISEFSRKIIYGIIFFAIFNNLLVNINLSERYSWDTYNINSQPVAIAKWIDANISKDARIGLNDAGAMIFFSSSSANHTFVDLMGLNTHRRIGKDLNEFIEEEKLDYLVIYNEWFPNIKKHFFLEEIHNITLTHNTATGADTIHVYRLLERNKSNSD